MPFATTRMDLKIIIISKPNEDKYDVTYMWNLKKKKLTQMNLCTKQKETRRHRKQTYDYQRGKGRKG